MHLAFKELKSKSNSTSPRHHTARLRSLLMSLPFFTILSLWSINRRNKISLSERMLALLNLSLQQAYQQIPSPQRRAWQIVVLMTQSTVLNLHNPIFTSFNASRRGCMEMRYLTSRLISEPISSALISMASAAQSELEKNVTSISFEKVRVITDLNTN